MLRCLLAIAVWGLTGCLAAEGAGPQPTSIEPSQSDASEALAVLVRGRNFEPSLMVDFSVSSRSQLVAAFQVRLDDVELTDVKLTGDGLTAVVPAGVARGAHDLIVTDAQGRRGTLDQAFRVVPTTDDVASFRFDDLGMQTVGVPFSVTVTALDAEGRSVEAFDGALALWAASGTLGVLSVGPFELGRQTAWVVLDVAAPVQVLHADGGGRVGLSQPFEVAPAPPAALVALSAPQTILAGSCSAMVRLQVVDARAQVTPMPVASQALLESAPGDGVSFYGDAACLAPLEHLPLPAGATAVDFWFSATQSGPLSVRVVPATLPSVTQLHQVQAGPPVRLRFDSASPLLQVGGCSPAVRVQVVDAFGNLSAPSGALPLSASAEPLGMLSLFSDAACTAPVSSLPVQPPGHEASFFVRADALGTATLTVQGPALSAASQLVQVGP